MVNMRTTYQHYDIMLDFMEKYGDLSRPKSRLGKRGYAKVWCDLVDALNNLSAGESRPEEKWKKVWSDFKNNTRKKSAKIKERGPKLCNLTLSDVESRLLSLLDGEPFEGVFVPANTSKNPGVHIEENEKCSEDIVLKKEAFPCSSTLTSTASNKEATMSTTTTNVRKKKLSQVQQLKWKTRPEIIEAIKQMDLFDCLKSISSQKRDLDEYDHFAFVIASKIRKIDNSDDREQLMNSIHNLAYEFHMKSKEGNSSDYPR